MVKNIVMNVQWVKCTHACREIIFTWKRYFLSGCKSNGIPRSNLFSSVKRYAHQILQVRNSVIWSVQDAHVQCSNVQCSKMINFVFMAKSIILAQFCCQPRSQGREPGNKVVLLPEADRQRINVVLFLADCALSLSVLRRGSRWVHPITKTMP